MIPINIMPQPDDITCGPTSLQAVYQYYGDSISLEQVIKEVTVLEEGGTLAVHLGSHALKRGYRVKLYTYNLKVFDPTWFSGEKIDLAERLREQLNHKKNKKLERDTEAYFEFLQLGGTLLFQNLTAGLLRKYFNSRMPILAGLSATYLYNSKREYTGPENKSVADDVRGYPAGHFVVLCGFDPHADKESIIVADPYKENPITKDNYYSVNIERLVNAIMLGIVTYDANLLILEPRT